MDQNSLVLHRTRLQSLKLVREQEAQQIAEVFLEKFRKNLLIATSQLSRQQVKNVVYEFRKKNRHPGRQLKPNSRS